MVERPEPKSCEQTLCLDKGYDNPTGHEVTQRHRYIPHVRPIREDRREAHGHDAGRPVDG